jgi:peptidoglycan/xylan/chitin deacetylase (PgdA/CDA1 family)
MVGTRIKNFMFHRVNPERDKLWDPMDVSRFEQIIRFLSKKYEIVLLEEYCGKNVKFKGGWPLATITFDDGYLDNLEYAAPILQKYGCKASFYVVTDCIDSGRMIWTQEIKHYLKSTKLLHFKCDLSYLPEKLQVNKWQNDNERLAYAHAIRNFLVKANQRIREYFLNDLRSAFTDVEPLNVMMNWDNVRQLHSEGHVIGSHTKSHPALPTLEKISEIETELQHSGSRILEALGTFPDSIAYPFGAYNDDVIEAAKRTGYKFGIAVDQEWYYPDKASLYTIPRTGLVNEMWLKTISRIDGSFEQLRRIVNGRADHWKPNSATGNMVLSAGSLATYALKAFD